jgi:hypothetical protein
MPLALALLSALSLQSIAPKGSYDMASMIITSMLHFYTNIAKSVFGWSF